MHNLTRREFIVTASAAALTAKSLAAAPSTQRVFIGSNTPDGILAYDWNPATAELTSVGVAARVANIDWLTSLKTIKSVNNVVQNETRYIFAASEVDEFQGKPTGAVLSFLLNDGQLEPISAVNSAGKGTCHIAVTTVGAVVSHSAVNSAGQHTIRVPMGRSGSAATILLSADYGGGSAASFKITDGKLSPAIWTEHYTGSGPRKDRQESAHAHFASFSPDNQFAYINDLGSDCIHIYRLNTATAELKPAGSYKSRPGAGPRTLHFHPNNKTAYCVNELDSTVDVLEWHKHDGSLTLITRIELLTPDMTGPTRACDTVITRDGRNVYFANRDHDFLYSFSADAMTGALTPIARTSCGGKTPRNFTLDPTEHWMLVANQDSNNISVFARDPQTGALANEGKSYAVPAPMRILF